MTKLGKYEVIAELAKGSMGVLYRARDSVLDREVALKTIAGTGSLDPELKERFYREARAGARLHHPNVITVYELGEQQELVFIALELLSGMDLRQFIAQRVNLPVEKKIAIMAAVCDGLHHAHQNGITHRDIKPSNIFLTDTQVPKILDFGVARLSASKLTVVGRVLGTPFYMAPEQIMGEPCDARIDLFSLAIVTFEFLSFAHPFAGESIPKRIINDTPDSILRHNPDLPRALDATLFKALSRKPTDRYQTVEEFGRALRSVIEDSRPAAPQQPRVPASAPPAPAPPAVPALPKYANTEHKMSAILMALQGFDEAVEQKNLDLARTALQTIESLAKIDERFATAAKESRARFQELEASMPPEPARVQAPEPAIVRPTPPPRPAPPPRTAPPAPTPTVSSHVAPEPPAARTSLPPEPPGARTTIPPGARGTTGPSIPSESSDNATSMFRLPDVQSARPTHSAPPRPTPIPPSSRPPTNPPAPPRTRGPHPPAAPTSPPLAPQVTQPLLSFPAPGTPTPAARIDRKILIVAGAGLAIILIVVVTWLLNRGGSVAVVPAAGTAQIGAEQALVRQSPSDSADIVVTLKKGDTVNVIRPPRSRSQEWTEVQYVAGKTPSAAGAIHTADLTNWSSSKPDIALYFIEMYAPGPGAGEAELRQYAQNLSAFIQHFSGSPQQNDAKAELDKTNAALAQFTTAGKGAAPAKPAAAPFDSEAELKRAEKAWENGDYDSAERLLRRILQQKPDFPAARMLLDKVQKAKQLEGTR